MIKAKIKNKKCLYFLKVGLAVKNGEKIAPLPPGQTDSSDIEASPVDSHQKHPVNMIFSVVTNISEVRCWLCGSFEGRRNPDIWEDVSI